jgi:hypothetical protein
MIPPDIMEYTISTSKDVNIETTLKVLASPNEKVESIPGGEQHSDSVVRYVLDCVIYQFSFLSMYEVDADKT